MFHLFLLASLPTLQWIMTTEATAQDRMHIVNYTITKTD